MSKRENFDKLISYITRPGINEFVTWLETETDYFTAPSSCEHHGNHEGGLLEHSLFVTEFALHNFNRIIKYKPDYEYLRESVIICALFHDVCKTNFYYTSEKWFKDETGKWKSYNGYKINDAFPYGHGEKSVHLISQHMKLTNQEAIAIRWHMSNHSITSEAERYAYEAAFNQPLVKIIQSADVLALCIETELDLKHI